MKTYKTMVIYDNDGYLIKEGQGQPVHLPVGVPYIYEEIPQGKKLISGLVDGVRIPQVDVTVTPHKLILEDIPPTEIDILRQEDLNNKEAIAELYMLTMGGI